MSKTLQNILVDSAAYLDLTASLPTDAELLTRANYADRAVREAASAGHLSEFTKLFETYATASTLSLPTDFREAEEALYIVDSAGGWIEFPIISVREKFKHGVAEQFAFITGNRAEGFILTINNLASYTSLSMVYQQFPTGLPTLASVCELSDEVYVTRKVEALVLESRSDNRFQLVDADANRRLSNMVGRSNKKPAGTGNRTSMNFVNPLG